MRSRSARLERSEALLGRSPLHYGGHLHMWGQFYMGGTGGSIPVAPANNIRFFWGEARKNILKIAQLHRLPLQIVLKWGGEGGGGGWGGWGQKRVQNGSKTGKIWPPKRPKDGSKMG